MKWLLSFIAIPLMALAAFGQSQVVVTGNVSGATSGTVTFALSPWSPGVQYYVPNVTTIAGQNQTCSINSSGAVVATNGGGACLVWGNDIIAPANTTYTVTFAPAGRTTNTVPQENIVGSTYNLNAPVFAPKVTLVPQYNSIITNPAALAVNVVPLAPHAYTVGLPGDPYANGYFDNLTTGNLNLSNLTLGSLTVNGGITANSVSSLSYNNVEECDTQPGANAGIKIFASCINALPATGGVADARGILGNQVMTSQAVISKSNVTVLLGCMTLTLSGVIAQQGPPFGTNIQIANGSTVSNVAIVGDPSGCTHLILAPGEQSIPITCFHGSVNCRIENLEIDGNKSNNTSIVDDTFQTGIVVLANSSSGQVGNSSAIIRNNYIHDTNHDCMSWYGNLANANTFQGNRLINCGKNDTQGTGDGINSGFGGSNNRIIDNFIAGTNRTCVRLTTAGSPQMGNQINRNQCYQSGQQGIYLLEQDNYGSVAGVCQTGTSITDNVVELSAQSGIAVAVATSTTDKGCILMAQVNDNVVLSAGAFGILVQGLADTVNTVRLLSVSGNTVTGSLDQGIGVGANVLDTELFPNVVFNNNGGGQQILDSGTRTMSVCNKVEISDGVCSIGPLTSTSQIVANNFLIPNGSIGTFNYGFGDLTRTWTLGATGPGSGEITSGDGAGQFVFSNTGGVNSPIFTSTVATGTAPFTVTSTTPVANLQSSPTTYGHTGTAVTTIHHVLDTATLSSGTVTVTLTGSAIYSAQSSYVCSAVDITAGNNAVLVEQTDGSHFTLVGNSADVVIYACTGR